MAIADTDSKTRTLFSGLSPAGPSTVIAPGGIVGIGQSSVCIVDALLLGATGGPLDVYIQSSVDALQDGSGSWYDVIHFTQLAAAAPAARWIFTLTRGFSKVAAALNAVNPVDGTPTLTANSAIPDAFGGALRVVFVAGAATSAGATQRIKLFLSKV